MKSRILVVVLSLLTPLVVWRFVSYQGKQWLKWPQLEGFAYEWGLTDRGKQWLKWAQRQYKNSLT